MQYKNQTVEEFGIIDPMIQWDTFWTPREDLVEYEEADAGCR